MGGSCVRKLRVGTDVSTSGCHNDSTVGGRIGGTKVGSARLGVKVGRLRAETSKDEVMELMAGRKEVMGLGIS